MRDQGNNTTSRDHGQASAVTVNAQDLPTSHGASALSREAIPAGANAPSGREHDFRDLRNRVKEAGLLEPRSRPFAINLGVVGALLVAGIAFLVLFHGRVGILLGAFFLGIVWVQLAFIVHDAGHRQGFLRRWQNALVGIICGDLLTGGSYNWWVRKHNEHHAHPNHLDMDPDIDIPLLAFTPEQAQAKRGLFRLAAKYQVYLAVPLLTLLSYGQRIASIQFLRRERTRDRWWEAAAMIVNFALYFGVPLVLLGPWSALLFIVIHQAVIGVYLGLVFAPNHKGMEIVDGETVLDPLRAQVLTSRNVKGHPITDWFYGGLNYQIEHHLFPSMARGRLGAAQRIVREFCQERGISYHETSVLRSYVEILSALHAAAAPLRGRRRATATISG